MELDDLIATFVDLPEAEVGHGPQHPEKPDTTLQETIDDFVAAHPALLQDPGYLDFLYRYAGAYLIDIASCMSVDLLGFSDASTGFHDIDAPLVSEDGFLLFAIAIYDLPGQVTPEMIELDFAFDVTGTRAPGVYQYETRTGEQTVIRGPRLVTPDFLTWLHQVVDHRGILHD